MKRKVYISSTYKDLEEYRAAIIKMFFKDSLKDDYDLYGMEGYVAQDKMSIIEQCKRDVQKVDIYVLILANNYGSLVEGTDRSYTEIEYETARQVRGERPGAYSIFVFYSSPLTEAHDFREAQELKNNRMQSFFETAKKDNPRNFTPFNNPESLCYQMLLTLTYNFKKPKGLADFKNYLLQLDRVDPAMDYCSCRKANKNAFYFSSAYPNNADDFLARLHNNEIGQDYTKIDIGLSELRSSEAGKFEAGFKKRLQLTSGFVDASQNYVHDFPGKLLVSLRISDTELSQNPYKLAFLENTLQNFFRAYFAQGTHTPGERLFCIYYTYQEADPALYAQFGSFVRHFDDSPGLTGFSFGQVEDLDDLNRYDIRNWFRAYIPDFPDDQDEVDRVLKIQEDPDRTYRMKEAKKLITEWIETNLIDHDTDQKQ